jgi:peptide-methionine (S)-S-oxide reductase
MADIAPPRTALATLGGGCFWCLDAVYRELRGVLEVRSGYAGGRRPNPTYEQVCTGVTGHAEVVQLVFDPSVVAYRDLLGVFFSIHDPTTPDRQGHDVGTQYRSVIFWHDDEQRATAEAMIAELERDGVFDAPIVTQLVPFTELWPAEGYHQDYFTRNPEQPYCRAVVAPKVAKFRQKYVERLAR